MPGTEKQNSMFKKLKRGYVQEGHPLPVTSCGRRRNDGSPIAMTAASYEKSNRKMRSKYKKEPGKTLISRQTIMDTKSDVEEIKETLEKIEDKLYNR